MAEELLKKYGANSYNAAYKLVKEKLLSAIDHAKKSPPWREPATDWPRTMKGIFKFPNGKQGDINMFIATEFGVARKLEGLSWEIEIPTTELNMIECLCEYGIQSNEFIVKANTRFAVEPLLHDLMKLYHKADDEITREHWALNRIGTDIIRDYRESIRPKRNQIYEEVIKQGRTSGKWKSEQQAYALISTVFPDAIYQYHDSWLGLQSLDVFIPSLSIAVEYQGKQHYQAIDIFGGVEGLEYRLKKDQLKKNLCIERGIILIEWRYDEPLKVEYILTKIQEVLNGKK